MRRAEGQKMSELVALAGGLTVPREAFDLLLNLERRELLLRADGEMLRVSGPGGAKPELSADEAAAIKKWKRHLMTLITYTPPPVV
jgi:hypothetical protein